MKELNKIKVNYKRVKFKKFIILEIVFNFKQLIMRDLNIKKFFFLLGKSQI